MVIRGCPRDPGEVAVSARETATAMGVERSQLCEWGSGLGFTQGLSGTLEVAFSLQKEETGDAVLHIHACAHVCACMFRSLPPPMIIHM